MTRRVPCPLQSQWREKQNSARTRTPEPSMTPTQPLTPFCKSSRACPNFSSKVVDMAAICFWAARCVANNTTSSELIFRISLREVLDCVRVRM